MWEIPKTLLIVQGHCAILVSALAELTKSCAIGRISHMALKGTEEGKGKQRDVCIWDRGPRTGRLRSETLGRVAVRRAKWRGANFKLYSHSPCWWHGLFYSQVAATVIGASNLHIASAVDRLRAVMRCYWVSLVLELWTRGRLSSLGRIIIVEKRRGKSWARGVPCTDVAG